MHYFVYIFSKILKQKITCKYLIFFVKRAVGERNGGKILQDKKINRKQKHLIQMDHIATDPFIKS